MQTGVELDVQSLGALLGLIVPIAIAFLLKHNAPNALKVVINIAGSVLMALVAIWVQHNGKISGWLVINTMIVTLVASLAAYRGIWKPLNLNAYTAPNFGIGPARNMTINQDGKNV